MVYCCYYYSLISLFLPYLLQLHDTIDVPCRKGVNTSQVPDQNIVFQSRIVQPYHIRHPYCCRYHQVTWYPLRFDYFIFVNKLVYNIILPIEYINIITILYQWHSFFCILIPYYREFEPYESSLGLFYLPVSSKVIVRLPYNFQWISDNLIIPCSQLQDFLKYQ